MPRCANSNAQLLGNQNDILFNLPKHHRDPFDRILIAQLLLEQIPIISIDTVFDSYPIQKL
ncbi:hypothetical protein [Rivularia sp. PCC 7116]|uniref:hypothetical protein n=1 Tax=Rivularia sp. PCC 7116 TaxID=373994 RepID=UPI0002E03BC9|nr:hypothetical protein [Rivularia sp. PCC 7116]